MKIAKKIAELIQQGSYKTTSTDAGHSHEYTVDKDGNGVTNFTIGNAEEHQHKINNFKISSKNGHSHELPKEKIDDDA